MGLFDDLSRFLEARLDEFLQANPHLELMALEEQLRGQEAETINLLGELKRRQRQLEESILATAQDIQRWHARIAKAKAANRQDLIGPAQEREAALLRQGNQLWGQMQHVKERVEQTRELQQRIHVRRRELKTKIAQAQAERASRSTTTWDTGWNRPYSHYSQPPLDPVEEAFQRWETEEELDELKRKMGR